jgi:hypothetical protein
MNSFGHYFFELKKIQSHTFMSIKRFQTTIAFLISLATSFQSQIFCQVTTNEPTVSGAAGNWSNTGTWSTGNLPSQTTTVYVKNPVYVDLLARIPTQTSFNPISGFHQAFRNGTNGTCSDVGSPWNCWCPYSATDVNNNCNGLYVRQGGNYFIGQNATGSAKPDFTGTVASNSLVENNNLQVNLNFAVAYPSFNKDVVVNGLFQAPTSGVGPVFGSSAYYYNPIVGQINSVGLGNTTSNPAVPPSVTIKAPAGFQPNNNLIYSTSVLLDPVDSKNSYSTLIIEGTANNNNELADASKIGQVTFKSGVSEFRGGALIKKAGKVMVEENATLILGPSKCKVCDPTYPETYDLSKCTADCKVTRLNINDLGQMIIKEKGRVIVYGNVENNYSTGSDSEGLKIDGGLYIVGNLDLKNSTLTTTSSVNGGGYKGDIYTTGTITGNTSSQLFNETVVPCTVGPCVATQIVCNYKVKLSLGGVNLSGGVIPFCDYTPIVPSLETNATTPVAITNYSGYTFTWQQFNGTAWTDSTPISNPTTLPSPTLVNPPQGSTYSYRLKVSTADCIAYSPLFSVINNSNNIWRSGSYTNGTTDWATSNNWCFGVPGASNNTSNNSKPVLIESNAANRYPIINGNSYSLLGGLSITSGAKVDLTAGSLSIGGNLQLQGTAQFNASGTNTVTFTGAASTISLNSIASGSNLQFQNLTVASSAKLNLPAGPSVVIANASGAVGAVTDVFEITIPTNNNLNASAIKIAGDLTVNSTGEFNSICSGCVAAQGAYPSRSMVLFNGNNTLQLVGGTGKINFDNVLIRQDGSYTSTSSGPRIAFHTVGVTTTQEVNLYGKLYYGSGVSTSSRIFSSGAGFNLLSGTAATANGLLTIKSVSQFAESNGSIGELPNTSSSIADYRILGHVKVERFYPAASSFLYRYASYPLFSSVPSASYATRYIWDINKTPNGWTKVTNDMKGGAGYLVGLRSQNTGTNAVVSSSAVSTAVLGTGSGQRPSSLIQGPVKLLCADPATEFGCVEKSTPGWHLLGNPYPHPITWASSGDYIGKAGFGTDATSNDPSLGDGIARVIAIRDLSSNRLTYHAANAPWTFGSFTENYWFGRGDDNVDNSSIYRFNGQIDVGQAFYVYSYGTGSADKASTTPSFAQLVPDQTQLVVYENAKRLEENATKFLNSNLRTESPKNGRDKLVITAKTKNFEDQAFHKFTLSPNSKKGNQYSLPKVPSADLSVFLFENEGEQLLNLESAGLDQDQKIKIGVFVPSREEIKLSFSFADNFMFKNEIFLIDSYEGVSYPLSSGDGYTFTPDKEMANITDRFYLSRNPLNIEDSNLVASVFPNPSGDYINLRIPVSMVGAGAQILSSDGIVIKDMTLGAVVTKIDISSFADGLYLVVVNSNKGKNVMKFIKNE